MDSGYNPHNFYQPINVEQLEDDDEMQIDSQVEMNMGGASAAGHLDEEMAENTSAAAGGYNTMQETTMQQDDTGYKFVIVEKDTQRPLEPVQYEPLLDSVQLKGKDIVKPIKSEKEFETEIQRIS